MGVQTTGHEPKHIFSLFACGHQCHWHRACVVQKESWKRIVFLLSFLPKRSRHCRLCCLFHASLICLLRSSNRCCCAIFSCNKFRWSVCTVSSWPSRIFSKDLSISTMLNNSCSPVVCLCCASFISRCTLADVTFPPIWGVLTLCPRPADRTNC